MIKKNKINEEALNILNRLWPDGATPPRWWDDRRIARMLPADDEATIKSVDLQKWRAETKRTMKGIKRGWRASTVEAMQKVDIRKKALDKELVKEVSAAVVAVRKKG